MEGQKLQLNALEDSVREKYLSMGLRRDRNFLLVLENWKFVMQRVPNQKEFYFDITTKTNGWT